MKEPASFVVLLPRSMVTARDWAKYGGTKSFTSKSAFDGYLSALEVGGHAIDRRNPSCAVVSPSAAFLHVDRPQQWHKSPVLAQSGVGLIDRPANLVSSPLAARIVNLAIYFRRLERDPVQFDDEMHKKVVLIDLQRFAVEYITSATLDHEAESARSRALAAGRAQRAPQARSEARPAGPEGLTCK